MTITLDAGQLYVDGRTLWQETAVSWAGRNPSTAYEMDKLWTADYGFKRTTCLERCLRDVPRDAKILEVGTSRGAQLDVLAGLGFTDLMGVDLSAEVLTKNPSPCVAGDVIGLPFADRSFDLVFTSGTLVHVPPSNPRTCAIREMLRVSCRWMLTTEYWNEKGVVMFYFEDNLVPPIWTDHWAAAIRKVDPSVKVLLRWGINSVSGTSQPLETVLVEKAA